MTYLTFQKGTPFWKDEEMSMKKKLTALLFALIFSVILIGCSSKTETTLVTNTTTTPVESSHQHTFSQAWSSDSKKHYHLATCGHDVRSNEENHIYGDWIIITEATETTKGSKKQVCSVCGYENVVEISEISHTHTYSSSWSYDAIKHWHSSTCGHDVKSDEGIHVYGTWITILEATETTKGSKKQVCSVCGYENIVEIPELTHTHTFSSNWSYDATKHWHISTCGHDVRQAEGEHTYGDWITITPATGTTEGSKKQVCSACGYEKYDVIEIEGHTHSYSAVWSKNEETHWHECSCGSKTAETEHQYGQWTTIVPATETSKGSMRRVCKICYYIEVIETDMLEHVHDYVLKIEDSKHWYECRCGDKINEDEHDFKEGICTVCEYSIVFSYTVFEKNTCQLNVYNGNKNVQSLKIPQVINGYKVVAIRWGLLEGLDNLIELTIPFVGGELNITNEVGDLLHKFEYIFGDYKIPQKLTKVTVLGGNIRDKAFYFCDNLVNITIPDSVTSIGDYAFYGCNNLVSITIPDSVTSIGEAAFKKCYRLISIGNTSNVRSIGEAAFSECYSLTSIVIGRYVTNIGEDAFWGCRSLIEVINKSLLNIVADSDEYGYVGFYALNVKKDDKNDIVNKDGYLFYTYERVNYLVKYIGAETSLVLPNDYNGEIYNIYRSAFYYSNIENVEISAGVYRIGNQAFGYCESLISIVASDGVTSIGIQAFEYCESLNNVVLGNCVIEIGKYAFEYCENLQNIVIPNSVKSIGYGAFSICRSLKTVYYLGTPEQWHLISIDYDNLALWNNLYYYSSSQPTDTEYNYWHYDENGNPVAW